MVSGNLIKIAQDAVADVTPERLRLARTGLVNGIRNGKNFSGPITSIFMSWMNMLEEGMHKSDTETGALSLSFKRYMPNARTVSNNFSSFINIVNGTAEEADRQGRPRLDLLVGYFPAFTAVPEPPNNTENITMREHFSTLGSDKERLKFFKDRVIWVFNSKWEAILGAGDPNNPNEVLYAAIEDWRNYVAIMAEMNSRVQNRITPARNMRPAAPAPAPAPAPTDVDVDELLRAVTIASAVPVSPAGIRLDGADLVINRGSLSPGNDLIVRLEIVGGDAVAINSASSNDVFQALTAPPTGPIVIPGDVHNALHAAGRGLVDVFAPRTTISRANTIFMDIIMLGGSAPDLWRGTADGSFTLMTIRTRTGPNISINADDVDLLNGILKLSDGGQTTPLYETVSPSGKSITFTPAQLVAGGGRVKGKDGKSFKVKKWKGRSLADRVMSKEFGRVKTKKKKK